MRSSIFNEINSCQTPEALFDLIADYFEGQGFGGVAYLAPECAVAPFMLMERGMPQGFIAEFRERQRSRGNPLGGSVFRFGKPAQLQDIIDRAPTLDAEERAYVEMLRQAGLTESLVLPAYGPFARPGLLSLTNPVVDTLFEEMDIDLAAAVAQQLHMRMEHLQGRDPPRDLSPREREIVRWMSKGKSNADIATILGLSPATVTTHVQRVYAKLEVNDRVSCVAKAMAHHYV